MVAAARADRKHMGGLVRALVELALQAVCETSASYGFGIDPVPEGYCGPFSDAIWWDPSRCQVAQCADWGIIKTGAVMNVFGEQNCTSL
jgi:hypothetical protein